MTDVPRHCGPGQVAPCGCVWEAGQWDVCDAHRTPHSQHVTPCPACSDCDAAMDEARALSAELNFDESDMEVEL